ADLLAGITDVPSAKAAEPKLRAALQELEKINEQLDKSSDPEDLNQREARRMMEEVAKGIAAMQQLNTETLRVSKIPGASAALGDTWAKLPSVAMLEASGAIPKGK